VLEKLFLDWEEFVLVNSDENARYDDENYHRNVFKRSLTFFEKTSIFAIFILASCPDSMNFSNLI
jgi:hypothetical protein